MNTRLDILFGSNAAYEYAMSRFPANDRDALAELIEDVKCCKNNMACAFGINTMVAMCSLSFLATSAEMGNQLTAVASVANVLTLSGTAAAVVDLYDATSRLQEALNARGIALEEPRRPLGALMEALMRPQEPVVWI